MELNITALSYLDATNGKYNFRFMHIHELENNTIDFNYSIRQLE